ncbi:MAG: DUF2974 domain-containing protein [Atopobiaceae bacterium]|nr:DUF2974 domain-containing protein [Atopobiaceae bacterium]
MASIVDYARTARDTFTDRPLTRVDALCLAWLAYLRLPVELGVTNRAGVRLADLSEDWLRASLLASLRNAGRSWELLEAMSESPRFRNVRACLYVSESDESAGMQFSATTYVLPDNAGSVVAYRGTDDTVLGWKENVRLACDEAIPAQRRAATYLEDSAGELGGRFWVCGHSKGGALATYACGMAPDDVRTQVGVCWSFDGPGLAPELMSTPSWHGDAPFCKLVPRGSLVGMLFERSQDAMVVVRSSADDVHQHHPLTWEVLGNDFVLEHGVDYDAWRLSQRLNDWLEEMGPQQRAEFAELLCWLMDATGETSFSDLLRRWSSNSQGMRAALSNAPQADQDLFARAMDDLVATVLLGSRQELRPRDDTPQAHAGYAARKVEDATARVNDRLSKIDRLTGR